MLVARVCLALTSPNASALPFFTLPVAFSQCTPRARLGLEGVLTPLEAARLGSVVESTAYFNPFAPQGHYNLDMTVPGDRDVFRALLSLDKVGNPSQTKDSCSYRCGLDCDTAICHILKPTCFLVQSTENEIPSLFSKKRPKPLARTSYTVASNPFNTYLNELVPNTL